jgi:zinc-ribbon family
MIIFGIKASSLFTHKIASESCTHCGTHDSVNVNVFQRYFHVFWIPFFPIGKTSVTQCDHCRHALRQHEMPASLQNYCKSASAKVKTHIWSFSGLFLFGVLLTCVIISNQQDSRENAAYISAPAQGDIYELKEGEHAFTLLKVENVVKDTVFIHYHQYQVTKSTGLIDLKADKGLEYNPLLVSFSKQALKDMYDKGEILNIDRP